MVNRPKCRQFYAAFVASMGAITCGACISWINYEEYHREHARGEDSEEVNFEFIVYFLVSAGSAIFSILIIRSGGPLLSLKIGAMLTCMAWVISVWLLGFDQPFHTTINLFAIMCSFTFAPTPLYIGEISEKEVRGAFVSLLSMNWKLGTMIADLTFELHEAKLLCLICLAICLLQFLLLFHLYEAPFFLVLRRQEEHAREALMWLRNEDADIQRQLDDIESDVQPFREDHWLDMFYDCYHYRKIWVFIMGFIFFHQLTGATLAILVSSYVFERVLIDVSAYVCGLVSGIVQIVAIALSMCLVDKIGRRPLLMTSAIGIAIAGSALGICLSKKLFTWLTLASLLVYLAMYAIGYGPILWVLIAEIFPADCKLVACSFAVALFWLFKIIVDAIIQVCMYMDISETDFEYGFVLLGCAGITLFSLVFILFAVPETKRKTFAEIKEIFQ